MKFTQQQINDGWLDDKMAYKHYVIGHGNVTQYREGYERHLSRFPELSRVITQDLVAEAVKQLNDLAALGRIDPERAHSEAEAILLSQVPEPVRRAYKRLRDNSPWWAYA